MWDLHRIIKVSSKKKPYMIDEILDIMDSISTNNFKESLNILLPNNVISNGLQAGTLFVSGLSRNDYLEFRMFIEGFNGRS